MLLVSSVFENQYFMKEKLASHSTEEAQNTDMFQVWWDI